MGTNLSQVFVINDPVLGPTSGSDFNSLAGTAGANEGGVWNFKGSAYLTSRLYVSSVDLDAQDSATNEAGNLVTVANPAWLYTDLQFVQGTAGNPIATPLINTREIRRIKFDPYTASAGQIHTLADNTIDATKDRTFKFVVRNEPTSHLNFYDADNTGYIDLSGAGKKFPLGAFNTTNHKVINVEVVAADYTNFNTCMDKLADAVQAHGILNDLLVVSGTNEEIYTVRHAGVIVELIISDSSDGTVLTDITDTVTAGVIGVGNDWQVLGEEIRCRSRYGNFNRMYLPQNVPTYTQANRAYHKITVEYTHNWPSSTGIAPAGELNQVVLYVGGGTDADTAGETNIETIFGIADLTAGQEFVW
eukprot:GHVO01041616.1.p1 GENE.GHVO01041616.1~~GHVO01041616.1.p1  ORF type:complete len:361 (+),score=-13.87 GHVO01041616.1:439-1521(+)